jgi:Mn2+/Fe2+ NRAMP family transporter
MLFAYPLMSAIQEICGRIGRVTGLGISGNLRRHYPKKVLLSLVTLLCLANVINIGADLGIMAEAAQMLFGGNRTFYLFVFGLTTLFLEVYVPYSRYEVILKWMTLSLFAYVTTAFVIHFDWLEILKATVIPSFSFSADSFKMLIAIFGTTISPYLFFWQASQEVEDMQLEPRKLPLRSAPARANTELLRIRIDTYVGMGFSNAVAFFIILVTATTLHFHGITQIETATQAALALKPLAGKFASIFFALGIVGTGMLCIPVLSGSLAFSVGEIFAWPVGLEKKTHEAQRFYLLIALATFVGLILNVIRINPMRALYFTAILNGLVAAPMMVFILLISSNKEIMGTFTTPPVLLFLGWLATAVMILIGAAMICTSF